MKYLSNNLLNNSLIENGFVVIPLFNKDNIHQFIEHNKKCTSFFPNFNIDFSFIKKSNYRYLEVERILLNQHRKTICNHFIDYSILGIGFINKGIGWNNSLPYHQDWTMTDEKLHKPISIWFPLSKLNDKCGEMYIIPKSHTLPTNIRTLNNPTLTIDFNNIEIKNKVVKVNLKLGEAIIYFPNLFHATNVNRKMWIRRAVSVGLIPRNSKTYFYNKTNNEDEFEIRNLPKDFHRYYHNYILKKEFLKDKIIEKKIISSPIKNEKILIDYINQL